MDFIILHHVYEYRPDSMCCVMPCFGDVSYTQYTTYRVLINDEKKEFSRIIIIVQDTAKLESCIS